MAPRENDFDPTTWSDELMDRMSTSLGQTGGRSMPQDWQRLKVTAEMKRRARLKADGKPTEPVARPVTNVDANLAAAATPIVLEPEAGGIEARHAVRVAELVRQGVPRTQAIEIAGREVIQEQSAEADARADARIQSGELDPRQTAYNAETFAEGYGFDANKQPAYLGRVDIDNMSEQDLRDQGERRYNARDPRGAEAMAAGGEIGSDYAPSASTRRPAGMTAPGPRTLDGRPTAPPRPLMRPEDVEAYDVRPPNGLSARDRDMALRGFVPVVTPDGVTYMRAAGDTQTIGGPGRAGSRPDLLTKENADQQWAVSEPGDYMGPDGKPVSVLVPGPKMLEKRAADLEGRQAAYQAKKAGMDADREEAKKMWRATAMLAGGSQNINFGNRAAYNQLAMLNPEDRERALLYMTPAGRLLAGVDGQNMQNAGNIIERFMTSGAAAGMMNPAAAQQQAEANKLKMRQADPAAAGRGDIASGDWQSPEATAEAERLAEQHDTGGWNSMSWEDEAALAATLQRDPYNLPQPEAEAAANRAANKRRWQWLRGQQDGAAPAGTAAPGSAPPV